MKSHIGHILCCGQHCQQMTLTDFTSQVWAGGGVIFQPSGGHSFEGANAERHI